MGHFCIRLHLPFGDGDPQDSEVVVADVQARHCGRPTAGCLDTVGNAVGDARPGGLTVLGCLNVPISIRTRRLPKICEGESGPPPKTLASHPDSRAPTCLHAGTEALISGGRRPRSPMARPFVIRRDHFPVISLTIGRTVPVMTTLQTHTSNVRCLVVSRVKVGALW
jgi:hypothetical protein